MPNQIITIDIFKQLFRKIKLAVQGGRKQELALALGLLKNFGKFPDIFLPQSHSVSIRKQILIFH